MAQTFDYNPDLASAALTSYGVLEQRVEPGQAPAMVNTWAGDLVQGQMGALVRAELLAAQAGVVPWVDLGDGVKGVLDIGAARSKIDGAPEDVRAIYLASHGAVRQSVALSRPSRGERLPIEALATSYYVRSANGERIVPIIVLVVVGVAALAAGAWYASETKKTQIETDARKAIEMSKAAKAAELGMEALRQGKPIPQGVWDSLKPAAEKERGMPWVTVGLGVAVGVGLSYGAYRAAKALRLVA